MDPESIRAYIASAYEGVDIEVASQESGAPELAWGDTFFIYDPERTLTGPKRFPFATIVTKDYGDFDNASNLDRDGVYRLNIGVPKETYETLFGEGGDFDFTALDRLMPHPVYGQNHWVCVLNPSDDTFEGVKPLLAQALGVAAGRYERVRRRGSGGGAAHIE